MFVIYNEDTKKPIRVWLPSQEQLEETCLKQAYHLAQLPFVHKWVNLMPDTHAGMGMPIGGVLATKEVIIPNAVGVDIGCGMAFSATNIQVADIENIQTENGSLLQGIVGDIMRAVPVGFSHHKLPQVSYTLNRAENELEKYESDTELLSLFEAGTYSIGTLGGGNHFIELQVDDDGYLGLMLHSGSRNLGKNICDYFHYMARGLNTRWKSAVPDEFRLAFLPTDTKEGQQYLHWMQLAMDFAFENRAKMLLACKAVLEKWIGKYTDFHLEFVEDINCHHNYAALEHHYGEDVWVHRKGANRARLGEKAVIPGAMGSYSYVVEGLGNEESFQSSSHGAGRNYSRKGAMAKFSVEDVMNDLKEQNVILGKRSKEDIPEESRFAYKNIDEVMENQKDLVKATRRLKTVAVIKA